ncbi:MAG: polysaccharide biosynthesis protein [Nitrospirae bacterium]|nr:polysaccharide biosynthesis protein [Nitrospirota bacterium]
MLDEKRILVTGGTGSLGQALVRRLLSGEVGTPARITVFSRDEAKQHTMRLEYFRRQAATDEIIYEKARELLRFHVGDVRDYSAVLDAVRESEVIVHAAAMKQVPTCEYFPNEVIRTNVQGAQNVVRSIKENHTSVETVVGVSTDKACKPVNIMGMTKALQERILIQANLDGPHTRFVCVRYGNVVGSRGSVVPLFLDQIERGGPVSITVPEMTRFLLSLDRAVTTVFDALRYSEPGDTLIPKLPAARVTQIAETLIDGRDIPVVHMGIRPGEKVHEILISEEERHRASDRNEYYVIEPVLPELRPKSVRPPALRAEYSSQDVTLDGNGLRALLAPYLPPRKAFGLVA